jgi:peptide/nickel transport system permease protein
MFTYLLRRVILMLPTLVGITVVVFLTMALLPGGIGAALHNAEFGMRPEERKAMEAYYNKRYGLDQPLYRQYSRWIAHVTPFGAKEPGEGFPKSWSFGFKAPDLGESFAKHRPVSALILEALPISLLLELLSIPLIYGIAIWTGIRAARARGELMDVGLGAFLLALFSLPEIWVGVAMIGFLTNREAYVHWFPSNGLHDILADGMTFLPHHTPGAGWERGWLLDTAWHLCLPLICISYSGFAYLSRLQRGALLETLGQDFVRTARAKGLPERAVLYRHAFRNSVMPLITVAANILPGLIGGAVIVETIFGIPGMGRLFVDSANFRDREMIMALVLIASLLQLTGNLIADVSYAIADPRVTYD